MKLYLAGPMTGIENFNYPTFRTAASKLRLSGFEVVNPAEFFNGDQRKTRIEYMREDFTQLRKCDAVVVLSGWENSPGACAEVAFAEQMEIPWFPIAKALLDPHHFTSEVSKWWI